MPPTNRTRLVILFGGRSAEHDVSCISALHVLRAIDATRYDVHAIGITRDGRWIEAADAVAALPAGATALPSPDSLSAPSVDPVPALTLTPAVVGAASAAATGTAGEADQSPLVVLPLLHGPMGEDGTVQGLLELAGVPYVGAGVLGSAVCMDKAVAKEILAHHGLPQGRWISARDVDIDEAFIVRVGEELGYPAFVKPANLGSSIGVSKVADAAELATALDTAIGYDEYVVVEEAINGREIECSVLGNAHPRASVPGEVVPSHEFYDYDDKYFAGTAELHAPADLPSDVAVEIQRLAVSAYRALRIDGMARVDFFYDEAGSRVLINEVNTIPGFTEISMYPKLWEASGISYAKLIDDLVELALERHRRRTRMLGAGSGSGVDADAD